MKYHPAHALRRTHRTDSRKPSTVLVSRTARPFCNFRDRCEEAIGPAAVKICVENSSGFTDFHMEALALLLESHRFPQALHSLGFQDSPALLCLRQRKIFLQIDLPRAQREMVLLPHPVVKSALRVQASEGLYENHS